MGQNDAKLLTPDELAGELHVSRRTLDRWRWLGIGPPYIKLHGSGSIRYESERVQGWLDVQRRCSTSDPGEAAPS
jgi:hypothetical protein